MHRNNSPNQKANTDRKLLVSCGILKKEIESLISKNNWPINTVFLDSSLHVEPDRLLSSLIIVLSRHRERKVSVIFGACHPMLDDVLAMLGIKRMQAQNCIGMLIGKKIFEEQLSDGAFFLLEDWARKWVRILEKTFGDSPEMIKQVFQQGHKYNTCSQSKLHIRITSRMPPINARKKSDCP